MTRRLIDADAMHKYVDDELEKGEGAFAYGVPYEWAWTLTAVDCAPTIDAVEVVRCKDCKHFDTVDCAMFLDSKDNDFCSYGERKDECD